MHIFWWTVEQIAVPSAVVCRLSPVFIWFCLVHTDPKADPDWIPPEMATLFGSSWLRKKQEQEDPTSTLNMLHHDCNWSRFPALFPHHKSPESFNISKCINPPGWRNPNKCLLFQSQTSTPYSETMVLGSRFLSQGKQPTKIQSIGSCKNVVLSSYTSNMYRSLVYSESPPLANHPSLNKNS